ncbi:quinoprotein dehydrogenase-associated SoxYZ-like carrier [Arcobacter acticola]|uniref:Quinoprotein dehydrogenase-associated SoxYZ-like carrier n=1 Tax=Arcobacter acticola TaxID=1849015 RepID=A0A6M8EIQ9_9BACT|nr:quinoprotein dehydrogenase-associated SoxYZ-like carrier [Arcobacter acticola]QKE27789.1 quinoprotein dehydrogenase-associated SoxYZ-like carrier [Arcobacter acticola]
MKYIFFLLIYFLFAQNTYANNPVESPTFDDILKRIIQDDKYIFDDKNINIKVPLFADNPVQVPIFVDAKAIKNAKRLILFADLNPIEKIIDMDLVNLLPIVSLNIKVAQETPIRALILDDKGLWHIGSNNIKSFGGGCSVSSVASTDTNFDKLLGKAKGNVFKTPDSIRLKASIFHPMETGLVFGNSEFYINKITIKADDKVLANIDAYSSISENPRFIFETTLESQNYKIEFFDIDGNKFNMDIK